MNEKTLVEIEKAKSWFVLAQITVIIAGFYFTASSFQQTFGLNIDRVVALILIIFALIFGIIGIKGIREIKVVEVDGGD